MKKKEQIALLEATLRRDPANKEAKTALELLKKKKHKYGAQKTTLCRWCAGPLPPGWTTDQRCPCGTTIENNWRTFDSKREAEYYQELKTLMKAGEIDEIRVQPEFELQPAFEKNGKKHRAITYRADFQIYYADGRITIVDVKGYQTKEFKIKRKLFEARYPDLELVII